MNETITICVGQAGVQLGECVWRQYNADHSILCDGTHNDETKESSTAFTSFYHEQKSGKYTPRCLMIDSNRTTIDNIKASKCYRFGLYDSKYFLTHKFDAENNFATGFYVIGSEMMETINNKIRSLVNQCDNLQGFVIKHSVCGGTGSGLGSAILKNITDNYDKTSKIGFEIFPSHDNTLAPVGCIVEPYNSLLSMQYLQNYLNVSITLDNEALYKICQYWLRRPRPSRDIINNLSRKSISSITSNFRFDDKLGSIGVNEFVKTLVPFPRLHFMITSIAPICTPRDNESNQSIEDFYKKTGPLDFCVRGKDFFTKIPDFNAKRDKYIAMHLNYHGDVDVKKANECVKSFQKKGAICMVNWSPCSKVKILMKKQCVKKVDDDHIAEYKKSVCMVGNNAAIGRVFSERIGKKYDLMYSQKAFVHWYTGAGMEECEFEEARNDLHLLEKDYEKLTTNEVDTNKNKNKNEYENYRMILKKGGY